MTLPGIKRASVAKERTFSNKVGRLRAPSDVSMVSTPTTILITCIPKRKSEGTMLYLVQIVHKLLVMQRAGSSKQVETRRKRVQAA